MTRFFLSLWWISLTAFLPAQLPELVVPAGHTSHLLHLESSPSGGLLASTSIDETVKVWDAAAGRELHTYRPGHLARDLAWSADEEYLAVAAFNRIHLLSTADWSEVGGFAGWFTNGVCFHPRKNELYYVTQRHNSTGEDPLQLYAVSVPGGTPRRLATIPVEQERMVSTLDLSPDGSQLLLVQSTIAHLVATDGTGDPRPVAGARRFTPDGDLFFVSSQGDQASFGVRSPEGTERWSLAAPTAQAGNRDLVHTMGFHPQTGKFYWANQAGRVAHGKYRTGQPAMYEIPPETDRVVAAGADGTLYLADKTTHLIHASVPPDILRPRLFGERVLTPAQLAGREQPALLSWGRGQVKGLRFAGRQILTHGSADGVYTNGRLHYAGDGSLLAAGSNTTEKFSYRVPQRHDKPVVYKTGLGRTKGVAANADGKWLAVVAEKGYLLMNTETNKSAAKGQVGPEDPYFGEDAALSPKGGMLLLNVNRSRVGSSQTEPSARLVQMSSGKTFWEQKGRWENPRFSRDGKRIAAERYQYFGIFDVADGREISRHPLPEGRFPYQTEFNATLSYACYTHDNRAYIYDLTSNREFRLEVPGQTIPFERGTFFHDDFVAFAGREGMLRIFDLRNRRYVASLVRYANSDDWALVAPDGRFDATPGAMQRMYYRIGNQRVALEQLFGGYFTPGLAAEIFNRLPPGELPPNINRLRPAPEVKLTYEPANTRNLIVEDDDEGAEEHFIAARTQDAVLVVKGRAPQDRVAELRLYRNGKLLGDGERGLVVEDDTPEATGDERRFRVRLLPGNNVFRAVAVNGQQTESTPAYLTVTYNGPSTPSSTSPSGAVPSASAGSFSGPAGVTLHLVTIGIDRYANPAYNLNYATADANAIGQQLDARVRALVGRVRPHTIRDAGATKADILRQLGEVAAQADADDLLVLYFAGHGLVPDQQQGDFFLVPHDLQDPGQVRQRGLSARTLRQISTAVRAERQLFVLDACQSGGALAALSDARRGAAEEKAIATLARTTGTHWLTATDSQQLATEFDALGHGAFTYVLLEGLGGKADRDTDGAVTVSELKEYLERSLPALTQRHSGQPQYPNSFGFGRDFVVGKK